MLKSRLKKIRSLISCSIRDFKMNRQHLAVRSEKSDEKKFASLRMLCHMLDKGINNIGFERGHSKGIRDKACALVQDLSLVYKDDPSFIWCQKIIGEYESAQENGRLAGSASPRHYSSEEISFVEDFMLSRVSCRNFTGEKIDQGILDKIIKIAIDAPNGCCRQTARFYITQDENKIEKIIPCVAGLTNFSKVSCLVAVTAKVSFYDLIDKNLQFLDSALAAENFILAARLYNVFGTMCNIFQASTKDLALIKDSFSIPDSENVTMVMAIGYPYDIPQKPVRRNLSTFVKYI